MTDLEQTAGVTAQRGFGEPPSTRGISQGLANDSESCWLAWKQGHSCKELMRTSEKSFYFSSSCLKNKTPTFVKNLSFSVFKIVLVFF